MTWIVMNCWESASIVVKCCELSWVITLIHKYTSTQGQKYTRAQMQNDTSSQVHKHTSTQARKYVSMEVQKYASMHSMQVHKYLSTQAQVKMAEQNTHMSLSKRSPWFWVFQNSQNWAKLCISILPGYMGLG